MKYIDSSDTAESIHHAMDTLRYGVLTCHIHVASLTCTCVEVRSRPGTCSLC